MQGVVDIAQGGRVRLHAHAVVQGAELEVAGEREDIVAGNRSSCRTCGDVDSRKPQRGGRRAAVDFLDLEVPLATGIVGQDDMPVVGRGGHADRARAD